MNADIPNDPSDFEDPLSNYEPREFSSALEEALASETVAALESRPFAAVEATLSVKDAIDKLQNLNISSLLVVEGDQLVGIFTERDVLERVAEKYDEMASKPVRDVMTINPLVVDKSNPAAAALAAISAAGYRHVPVLDVDGSIVGIVSPRRVFEFLEARFDGAESA